MVVIKPPYRYRLKGAIISVGYHSVKEFAASIGYTQQQTNRIVAGWIFPSPEFQQRTARALGITIRELRELL